MIIYLRNHKKKVDKTVTYAKNTENKGVDKQEYIPNKRGIDVTEAMIDWLSGELVQWEGSDELASECAYRILFKISGSISSMMLE